MHRPVVELSVTETKTPSSPIESNVSVTPVTDPGSQSEPDSMPTVEEPADPALLLVAPDALSTPTKPVSRLSALAPAAPGQTDPLRLPTPDEIEHAVESQPTQPGLPALERSDPTGAVGVLGADGPGTGVDVGESQDATDPVRFDGVPSAPVTRTVIPAQGQGSGLVSADPTPADGAEPVLPALDDIVAGRGPAEIETVPDEVPAFRLDPAARPTVDMQTDASPSGTPAVEAPSTDEPSSSSAEAGPSSSASMTGSPSPKSDAFDPAPIDVLSAPLDLSGAKEAAPKAPQNRTDSASPRILPMITLLLAVAVVVLSLLLVVGE